MLSVVKLETWNSCCIATALDSEEVGWDRLSERVFGHQRPTLFD